MTTTTVSRFQARPIGTWVLRVLLGSVFLLAAFMKLSGKPMMIAEFDKVGLGQWFRYFTASLEVIGGVAVLIPRFSIPGALVLLLVDAGAFVAQVSVLHIDWIHTVVIAALLGTLIQLQRNSGVRRAA
jgi:putative oxidoreductase